MCILFSLQYMRSALQYMHRRFDAAFVLYHRDLAIEIGAVTHTQFGLGSAIQTTRNSLLVADILL
jgi:hypothetical protein